MVPVQGQLRQRRCPLQEDLPEDARALLDLRPPEDLRQESRHRPELRQRLLRGDQPLADLLRLPELRPFGVQQQLS